MGWRLAYQSPVIKNIIIEERFRQCHLLDGLSITTPQLTT
jgi:hypothetical protein